MTNHVLLDNLTHRNLKIHRVYGAAQGDNVNVARVFPAEFGRLQNEYPLFFLRSPETDEFETIALLGFSDKENLYLNDAGWQANCVPLSIQRQPLLIGFQEQVVDGVPTEVPVVHIDMDHQSVSETEGEPLFLPQGGDSPYLERMTSILLAIHEGHEAARALSRSLVGLELIEPVTIDIELGDGDRHGVAGLHTINEEKLKVLGGDALETLHRKGQLQDVFMMLASMPNLSRLIERKTGNPDS